jgi:hypothetical protein
MISSGQCCCRAPRFLFVVQRDAVNMADVTVMDNRIKPSTAVIGTA